MVKPFEDDTNETKQEEVVAPEPAVQRQTYEYALFLRNKASGECKVQQISVDTCDGENVLTARALFDKLSANTNLFEEGYSLVGMNIINCKPFIGG